MKKPIEVKIINETLTWQECHDRLLKAGKIKSLLIENCIFTGFLEGQYWYIDKGDKKNFGFCGIKIPADHFITRNKFMGFGASKLAKKTLIKFCQHNEKTN